MKRVNSQRLTMDLPRPATQSLRDPSRAARIRLALVALELRERPESERQQFREF